MDDRESISLKIDRRVLRKVEWLVEEEIFPSKNNAAEAILFGWLQDNGYIDVSETPLPRKLGRKKKAEQVKTR